MRVRIAQGRDDYLRAFRLVYRTYRKRGYMAPHPAEIRFGPHYAYRTTRTLIALDERGTVVGTLSVVGDNRAGLPMEAIYEAEVHWLRKCNRRLAEATGFAIAASRPSQGAVIFFALSRFLVQYCYWCRYDDLLITVHPVQVSFYEGVLGFELLGDCRPHPLVQGAPSVALRLDLRTAHCRVGSYLSRRYFYPRIPARYFLVPPMSERERRYFSALYYGSVNRAATIYEPPQRAA